MIPYKTPLITNVLFSLSLLINGLLYILCVTINGSHYFSFNAQIVPSLASRAPSYWFLCHFYMTSIVFDSFLASRHKMTQPHLSCSRSGTSHLSKEPWFSLLNFLFFYNWKTVFRDQLCALGVFITTGLVIVSRPFQQKVENTFFKRKIHPSFCYLTQI